jgi:hypothetical protein
VGLCAQLLASLTLAYSASQTPENLASIDKDDRIVFCTLERPPSKIASLSAVRFPVVSPAIPVEQTDIPRIPKPVVG